MVLIFYSSPLKKMWQENPLRGEKSEASLPTVPNSSRPDSPPNGVKEKKEKRKSSPNLAPVNLPSSSSSTSVPATTSPTTPTTPGTPTGSMSPLGLVVEDVFDTANSIFSRPISKLSVSKDLPRFSHHILIYKSHELVRNMEFTNTLLTFGAAL